MDRSQILHLETLSLNEIRMRYIFFFHSLSKTAKGKRYLSSVYSSPIHVSSFRCALHERKNTFLSECEIVDTIVSTDIQKLLAANRILNILQNQLKRENNWSLRKRIDKNTRETTIW